MRKTNKLQNHHTALESSTCIVVACKWKKSTMQSTKKPILNHYRCAIMFTNKLHKGFVSRKMSVTKQIVKSIYQGGQHR